MRFLDFLAPPSCVFCGVASVGQEKSICHACFADLPWNQPPVATSPGIIESVVAVTDYAFPVDKAIKALKFERKLFYSLALAEILCAGANVLSSDIDAILPVPLHWSRKLRRGFNQAAEIAKPVARLLNVPIIRCAKRCKPTPYQSGLDARARMRNLRGAFITSRKVDCQHVLIIDDVVTTGATTQALAKTLIDAGVRRVSVLAVARAVRHNPGDNQLTVGLKV